jgi:hypothetical protein
MSAVRRNAVISEDEAENRLASSGIIQQQDAPNVNEEEPNSNEDTEESIGSNDALFNLIRHILKCHIKENKSLNFGYSSIGSTNAPENVEQERMHDEMNQSQDNIQNM